MSIKMDRKQRFGAMSDGFLDLLGIEVEGDWINVRVHGSRSHIGYRPAGSGEGKRSGDHLIAGSHIQNEGGQMERGGAAIYGNTVAGAAERSEIAFELGDFRSQDEATGVEDAGDRCVQLRTKPTDLRRQIKIGNFRVHQKTQWLHHTVRTPVCQSRTEGAAPDLAAKKRKIRKKDGTSKLCLHCFITGTGTLTAECTDNADGTEEGWSRSFDNNIKDRNIRSAERVRARIVPIPAPSL